MSFEEICEFLGDCIQLELKDEAEGELTWAPSPLPNMLGKRPKAR